MHYNLHPSPRAQLFEPVSRIGISATMFSCPKEIQAFVMLVLILFEEAKPGYIIMLRARMFRSLIIRTGIPKPFIDYDKLFVKALDYSLNSVVLQTTVSND